MYFKAPFELYVDITSRCNLNCKFCMRDWKYYLNHKDNPLLIDLLKKEIMKNDIPGIIITGGEPFLSPQFLDFVGFLKENDKNVKVTTNGTLINEDNAKLLKKYNIDEIQVSIHSINEEINDSMTGKKGSLKKILRGIHILEKYDIPYTTKTTITNENVADIPNLYNYLSHLAVKTIKFTEVYYMGAAVEKVKKPAISELEDLRSFFNKISDKRVIFGSETLSYLKVGYPTICSLDNEYATTLEVLSDGTVIPCAFSVIFEEDLNIFKIGLKSAWEELIVYKKYKRLPDACNGCQLKNTCMGGCPARRIIFKKEYDPQCLKKGEKNEEKMVKA